MLYTDPDGRCGRIPDKDYYPGPCFPPAGPMPPPQFPSPFTFPLDHHSCYIPNKESQPAAPPPPQPVPWKNPSAYPSGLIDVGYIQGLSVYGDAGVETGNVGWEGVFDLYDFEYGYFKYRSFGAHLLGVGVGSTAYIGAVTGWSNFAIGARNVDNYAGPFDTFSGGANFPLIAQIGAGTQGFVSPDRSMRGAVEFISAGVGAGFDGGGISVTRQDSILLYKKPFHASGEGPTLQDANEFINFIQTRSGAPQTVRSAIIAIIWHNAQLWNDFRERVVSQ